MHFMRLRQSKDSHIQATLSVQISGTKRWRLMPLRRRSAPFLAMSLDIYRTHADYISNSVYFTFIDTYSSI